MNKKMNHKKLTLIISVIISIIIVLVAIFYFPDIQSEHAQEYELFTKIDNSSVEVIAPTTTATSISTATKKTTMTTTSTTVTTTSTTSFINTTKEITTTTVPKEDTISLETTIVSATEEAYNKYKYYFYRNSMRVHTHDCVYADPSCMEAIEGNYIDEARPCSVCNPDINIGTLYEPPVNTSISNNTSSSSSSNLVRNWTVSEMTYYSGSYGCYGASGRTLINNYSVACNSIPLGTTVYIKSSDGSIDGYYRVDDTGSMGGHVIDIFYSSYSNTPSSFRNLGRVSCEVWIVG